MATTYTDISPRTNAAASKKLLKRGQDMLTTERFGHFDPQGQNKTKTRKWRRYESLDPATTALTEGTTPTASTITYTDYTAVLEQYGNWVEITDVIADTHEDPVLMEMAGVCGEQAAETIELIRIAVLTAGTNVYYANGAASRATVDSPPTRGDFRKVYRQFKRNKAKEISKIIKASVKIATEPVNRAYFAMGHTDLDSDIRNLTGFIPIEKYAMSDKALPYEIGKIENTRIILTNLFDPWEESGASGTSYLSGGVEVPSAASCDVYPLIVVGMDAYGIVPLQGYNAVKVNIVNPGKADKSDPLGQTGFVSWKTYQACVILNQSWIARIECAATANPS